MHIRVARWTDQKMYHQTYGWAVRDKYVGNKKMEPLINCIVHTFNMENQNDIDEQNENILNHSSLSTLIRGLI